MKAKKIALWFCDTIIFVAIAIYRSVVGHTDDHYISLSDSWFSDVYYLGSNQVSVYDEPFFIVCMIIMGLYLLYALYSIIKGTDTDITLGFKLIAYIAAFVSVTYMYSAEYDCLVIAAIGIVSLILEVVVSDKKKTNE